jgi:hypothetical protein
VNGQPYSPRLGWVLALGFLTAGCNLRSEADVIGRYQMGTKPRLIVLDVKPDHTFSEIINIPGQTFPERFGRWSWTAGSISFDSLWIPMEFAPDYIVDADRTGSVKYTEPAHWVLDTNGLLGAFTLTFFLTQGSVS